MFQNCKLSAGILRSCFRTVSSPQESCAHVSEPYALRRNPALIFWNCTLFAGILRSCFRPVRSPQESCAHVSELYALRRNPALMFQNCKLSAGILRSCFRTVRSPQQTNYSCFKPRNRPTSPQTKTKKPANTGFQLTAGGFAVKIRCFTGP